MIAAAMGWIGTVGTIGAYVMLSRGSWTSSSVRYAALNSVGGLLCGAASSVYGAWPSVASNVLWSGVAAHSLVLTLHQRRLASRAVAEPVDVLEQVAQPVEEKLADTLPLLLGSLFDEHWIDPDAETIVLRAA